MIKIHTEHYLEGVSSIVIETEYGYFFGTARLNSEDEEYESRFLGFQIAEMRAVRRYYNEKLKRVNIVIKELDKIIRKSPKTEDLTYVKKRYNEYIQQKCDILNELCFCSEKAIDRKIDARINFINKRKKGE